MCNAWSVVAVCHLRVALMHFHVAATTFTYCPLLLFNIFNTLFVCKIKKNFVSLHTYKGNFQVCLLMKIHACASSCRHKAIKQQKVIFLTTIKHK